MSSSEQEHSHVYLLHQKYLFMVVKQHHIMPTEPNNFLSRMMTDVADV